jgi:hypothetical protein
MAWFRIAFAEKAFIRILGNHGYRLDSLTVDEGVAAMLEFYAEHRAQHTNLADGNDQMLLRWQNGMVDITRQLQRAGSDENPVFRLSLSFQVKHELPAEGERWHSDPTRPVQVPEFFTGSPLATRLSYAEV